MSLVKGRWEKNRKIFVFGEVSPGKMIRFGLLSSCWEVERLCGLVLFSLWASKLTQQSFVERYNERKDCNLRIETMEEAWHLVACDEIRSAPSRVGVCRRF